MIFGTPSPKMVFLQIDFLQLINKCDKNNAMMKGNGLIGAVIKYVHACEMKWVQIRDLA